MILESSNFGNDSVAEWSKASDSSFDGEIYVGSNPTADISSREFWSSPNITMKSSVLEFDIYYHIVLGAA